MEFFEWMGIGQTFYYIFGTMLRDSAETTAQYVYYVWLELIIGLAVGAALYALCLVMGGFGLYKMAKRANKKHAWLAFLPFANTVYAGYLAGEANFFGQKMKRAGLYAMLAEIGYVAISVISLVADFAMLGYYEKMPIVVNGVNGKTYFDYAPDVTKVPSQYKWLYYGAYANDGFGWINIVSYVLLFLFLVFLCVAHIALFRKYNPRNPMVPVLFSVFFPVRGFVYFALRNRTPVDYNAYMRSRMEAMRRQQQQYYGSYPPYGGPTSGPANGPYSGPASGPTNAPSDEPFSDFGDGKGDAKGTDSSDRDDPFGEF